jgi:hypothetical protein
MLFETLTEILRPRSQSTCLLTQVSDNRRELVCRTWQRLLSRRGGRLWMCHLHRDEHRVTSPPWTTPNRVLRRVDLVDWKDVWNIRLSRYDDTVFRRLVGTFMKVSLLRRAPIHTESKAVTTSRKHAPVSGLSSKFLLMLSIRLVSCSAELFLYRNPYCWPRRNPALIYSPRTVMS